MRPPSVRRLVRRAAALGLSTALVVAGAAFADTATADGDLLTAGNQSFVYLGEVAPGASLTVDVGFSLVCRNGSHVDAGQTVTLRLASASLPSGAAATATPGTIGPVPASWTDDGSLDCSTAPSPLLGSTNSLVTLRAPTVPNNGYVYTLGFSRSLSPAGSGDSTAVSGLTSVSFQLDVVANTPPRLTVPASQTYEGTTSGGWTADYAVTAEDAEDAPAPMPVCAPAVGDLLPLGTTTITCTVTDSGGLSDNGSFDVTVVDTTAPALTGLPAGLTLDTTDPAGAVLAFDPPSATDVVDPAPDVACSPGLGDVVPVGRSTVSCTATDESGNTSTDFFPVMTRLWQTVWEEPISGSTATLAANHGRNVPIKASVVVDGRPVVDGAAVLRVVGCAGGTAVDWALEYRPDPGRWFGHLDTSRFAGSGCYRASLVIDGVEAGAFRLDLSGAAATAANGQGAHRTNRTR
jgi:hypothetical protein